MAFTRKDQISDEDYNVIREAQVKRQGLLPDVLIGMLKSLDGILDGFPLSQLAHSLQTATRAEKGGASEEMILAALCHDVGKTISILNHGAIAAEIMKSYLSHDVYMVIHTHQEFQAKHFSVQYGKNVSRRAKFEQMPWYDLACRFSDEWDALAFDPSYETYSLDHFEPRIRQFFGKRPAA